MRMLGSTRRPAVLGGFLLASLCLAAFSPDVSWYTIDGGGATSTGGTFEVSGTIGQPDAGILSGGTFQITGGFWAGLTPPPISIVAWRSVRSHAGLGQLAITLDPSASGNGASGPTVETRQGGIQQIEVQFSDPVLLTNPAAVQVTGQTTLNGVLQPAVAYGPTGVSLTSATVMTITFAAPPSSSALPDQTCYLIDVAGSVQGTLGQVLTGDTDCRVRSLLGDATSSGLVNLSDAILLKTRISLSISASAHPEWDLDLSGGNISLADALLAKSQVVTATHRALCP